MSSNMERVAAMPDASLYVNRDGRRADDCVDSHGGGNLIKIPRFRWRDPSIPTRWEREGGKACIKFLYDRQQLPAQCEVEVGGDYYYIGPQRAGPPDRYES